MVANRQYDHEFKVQAVKLGQEIGQAKAAKELGISKNTMYTWTHAHRLGYLDLGCGTQTPQSALSLHEELVQLRAQLKAQDKEIRRLKKENDFLEEASAFFAASRLKSKKRTYEIYRVQDSRRHTQREYQFLLQTAPCHKAGILSVFSEQRPPLEISGTCRCHDADPCRG